MAVTKVPWQEADPVRIDPTNLKLVTAPVMLPVSLDEAKLQARVDADLTADDALIRVQIGAATAHIERETGRQLVTATWDFWCREWPDPRVIPLPLPPLQSVTSIQYYDASNVNQTLPTSSYRAQPTTRGEGSLYFDNAASLPALYDREDAIRIRFVAGYGFAEDVPDDLRVAVSLLAADWYKHREATTPGAAKEIPIGVERIIEKNRVKRVG
jgi:uncharacterized phiE125 gp8 family phage protein